MKEMMKLFAVGAFALLIAAPAAFAQINEISPLPVTEPIDVGGTILQPGNYVIRLAPRDVNRNIVQVLNADQSEVIASVLTIPHQSAPGEEKENTTFVFYPAGDGSMRALRTWYAPDAVSQGGHDIVYEQTRATQLAKLANTPVVSYEGTNADLGTTQLHVVTPQATVETYTPPAPVVVETPAPVPAPRVAGATETRPVQVAETRPMDMPHTAGSIPLIALLGILALGAAVGLRLVR